MPLRTKLDTYQIFGRCILGIAVVSFIVSGAILIPNKVRAFWPFSTTDADAAASVVTPDSETEVLQASTNTDPNPDKGLADAQISSDNALVADSGPSGTAADIVGTTQSDRISVYVIRPGDTLSDIAQMFDVSVNTILWANDLKSTSDVHPGDTLIILPISGIKRTVAAGDTLKSLAKKYNGDPDEIAEFNGLDENAPLVVGSTIIIPGGEVIAPAQSSVSKSKGSSHKRSVGAEPYLGGSGAAQDGYYSNPLPGALLTQSIHGWNAVDLGAARGTPIHAAADGTVIIARDNGAWNGGYGNYVVITHDNGTETLYAHMTNSIVSPGQAVTSGQVIGYVGMTGLATGPHLHFEVRGAANPFRDCDVGSVCEPE